MDYVVGFAFQADSPTNVLLLWKNRPEYMAGRLNGIGGKIEGDETPIEAMIREFHEECGIHTGLTDWDRFALLSGDDYNIHCFTARLPAEQFWSFKTVEDEEVVVMRTFNIINHPHMPNLDWLVPLAQHHTGKYFTTNKEI